MQIANRTTRYSYGDYNFTREVLLLPAESLGVLSKMTTKKFLGTWLKLILLFLLVAGTHILIWQFAAPSVATLLAPKYTPLTSEEEEAFRLKQKAFKAQQHAENTAECEAVHPNKVEILDKILFERCMRFKSYGWLEHPKDVHKRTVIEPMVEKIKETFLPIIFGFVYVFIGMLSMKVMWGWVRDTVLPFLRSRFSRMKERIADESILRTNKRLSAAVKQLDDLETLRDRGMITEEVFRERKDEIKGALAKLNNGHQ